jgi:hypothetical protein
MSRLAYILAASHSGSTLLAMLLGAHPEACTVGELKGDSLGEAESYRCSCGQRLKDCGFWNQVRQGMAQKGIEDYDVTRAGTSVFAVSSPYARRLLNPLPRNVFWETARDLALSLSPQWRAHLQRTQLRNAALVEVVQEVTGAKVIIDSSKLPLRLKYLLRNPALDIKVIRLVRDGRAVSLTYTDEWSFADASDPALRGGGTGERRAPPRQNMAEAAREWRRSNESADCIIDRLPESQWMRVRYEDLCAQPRPTLEQLCRFLELDPDKINLDFRSKAQHVIGNGMRLDSSSEIRLDERWRSVLPEDALRTFDAVAGGLNRQYRYS